MAVPTKVKHLLLSLVPRRRRARDPRRRATYYTGTENPDYSQPYSHARATTPIPPPTGGGFGGF